MTGGAGALEVWQARAPCHLTTAFTAGTTARDDKPLTTAADVAVAEAAPSQLCREQAEEQPLPGALKLKRSRLLRAGKAIAVVLSANAFEPPVQAQMMILVTTIAMRLFLYYSAFFFYNGAAGWQIQKVKPSEFAYFPSSAPIIVH